MAGKCLQPTLWRKICIICQFPCINSLTWPVPICQWFNNWLAKFLNIYLTIESQTSTSWLQHTKILRNQT